MGSRGDSLSRAIGLALPDGSGHVFWLAVLETADGHALARGQSTRLANSIVPSSAANELFEQLRLDLLCRGYEPSAQALAIPVNEWSADGQVVRQDTVLTPAPLPKPTRVDPDTFIEHCIDRRHLVVQHTLGGTPALLQLTSLGNSVLYAASNTSPSLIRATERELDLLRADAPRTVLDVRLFPDGTCLIADVLGYDGADTRSRPYAERAGLLRQVTSELHTAGLRQRNWQPAPIEGHELPSGAELAVDRKRWSTLGLMNQTAPRGHGVIVSQPS